ncbi:MAG: glycosyltransferase family 4 protein [Anaerolineae bacterium]|nr:glycosyltransferase family 4 protein [Anaerolineae bacterium]
MPWKVAFFSPLPPERSGIADYSAELLPYLARWVELALFVNDPDQVDDRLRTAFPVYPMGEYGRLRWQFDVALYQMGASMYHDAMYPVLLRYGGIVTLHEYNLHRFISTRTIPRGDFVGYMREMGYALGVEGVQMADEIRQGRREHPLTAVSLVERLLDRSQGVILHSRFAQERVLALRPGLRTAVIPAPVGEVPERLWTREELGCPKDALLFVSGGHVVQSKRLSLALEAFLRLRQEYPRARYVIIGEELRHDFDLSGWLAAHPVGDAVTYVGYCEDLRAFYSWLAAADVVINLRSPTLGEASAVALRALAAGRPVIVFDHGWYAELPDDACVKVPPEDGEALLAAMRRLAADPEMRRAVGERARRLALTEHTPVRAAERYAAFIQQVLTDDSVVPRGGDRG